MKTLVVLVENFGLNFSGGSTATIHLLKYLKGHFKVVVVAQKIGIHPFEDLVFYSYSRMEELDEIFKKFEKENSVGYADFHIATELIGRMPFYFTYHDNWPEMLQFTDDKTWAEERIATYQKIFSAANCTFSVSQAKLSFINKYAKYSLVVRNGLSQAITKKSKDEKLDNEPLKVMMAGTIDERKYIKALELFDSLRNISKENVQVDVYGHVNSQGIAAQMDNFDFVNLCGFKDGLDFNGYHLLLNTSLVENLSLSVVDAIANWTPVLAFNVGGLNEVVTKDNGNLAEPYNIRQMKQCLLSFASKKRVASIDQSVLTTFDWQASAEIMRKSMMN